MPGLGNAIQVAADAVNVEVSALAFFSEPPKTVFQHTYAQIQGQIASLQQSGQTNNLAQKHYVLSDYALLSSIGQLTASQVWTVDEAGYLEREPAGVHDVGLPGVPAGAVGSLRGDGLRAEQRQHAALLSAAQRREHAVLHDRHGA